MSKLDQWAEAQAKHEGFYKAGSVAERNKNPGNIIFGPLAQSFGSVAYWTHPKTKHDFAIFPSAAKGWEALERMLENAATGKSKVYNPEMTILEYASKYAPVRDEKGKLIPNINYATSIAHQLGLPITTKIKYLVEPEPMENTNLLSQRDLRWAADYLGQSKSTVGRYGCTVTSIAMGTSYFNQYVSPKDLAKKLTFTNDGLLVWTSLPSVTCFKLEKRFFGQQDTVIREALAHPKKIVLIQVENYHWVLGLGRNLFGGYRISDPWFGDNSTTKRYKSITGGAVLTLK